MTAFTEAVQRLQRAEDALQAAHAIVNAAERQHGPDSKQADAAIKGPQNAACDAHSAAEEELAKVPASTAQEALLKAHLLLNDAQMGDILKAVREDIARFVDAPDRADA